jgi:oxygen-independent coproporphyrinogen-3 oxidase
MQTMEQFLRALDGEIATYARQYSSGNTFETIFFGGGTPSLLPPSVLGRLLDALHKHYRIESGAEITVETNPGTVDREKLRAYRALGVNRLSIGIQSFHEDELKFLSRIHNADEARQCVEDAHHAGFENVSVDLIFSLPHQTPERWKANLEQAIALQPKHISAYSLIVEEHTPLFTMVKEGTVATLPEEADSRMYEETLALMEENGFHHYEVSNYARSGYECRHNKNYWNHSNYLSFGPSAHSFWKDGPTDGRRWWNVRSIAQYCENVSGGTLPVSGSETVDREKMLNEAIFLGLRTGELNVSMLRQVYGVDLFSTRSETLTEFSNEGLIQINDRSITLTRRGFLVCDAIAESLL